MNLFTRFSLRLTIPLFLLLLALLAEGYTLKHYLNLADTEEENKAVSLVTQDMTQLQTNVNYRLHKGDPEGVQSFIAGRGSNPNIEVVALTDDAGIIISSTSLKLVGVPISQALPDVDAAFMKEAGATLAGRVFLAKDRLSVSAYYPVIIGARVGEIRPHRVGILYLRYDLASAKAIRRHGLVHQGFAMAGFYAGCFLLLGLFLHLVLSKRVGRLVSASRRFAAGDLSVQTGVEGNDELAQIGEAFDTMVRKILSEQESLRKSEERFRMLAENSRDMIYRMSLPDGRYEYVSPASAALSGYAPEDFYRSPLQIQKVIHPDWHGYFKEQWEKLISGDVPPFYEYQIIDKSGGTRWVYQRNTLIRDAGGRPIAIQGIVTDITERKQAEEALRRLNRELRAISSCNQVLMRATDEQSLLEDVCRIICDEAGYRMAWVGYAENDEAKTIRPVAWAGFESGYIANAKLSWADDTERGRGPAGTVIRSGEIIYVQDFTTDPRMGPWRESALQRGYRSGIALPLKEEKRKVFGVLLIYSAETCAIIPEEIRLMEELAGDLAFGITVLRGRIQRKEAERSITLLNFALNNVREAAFLIDEHAKFHYVNEESCRLLGYGRDELLSRSVADVDPDFPPERWSDHWNELKAKRSLIFEGRHRARDGRIFPVEISANYFEYDGQGYNLALVRDITERKRAEEALRASEQNLALHVMQTPLGVIEWDIDFKVTKWNPAAERIFGYRESEALGTHASLIVPPGAKDRVDQVWSDLIHRKGGLRSTNENITKDGRLIYCEWYNTPLVDAGGKVIAVASLVQDITERKEAEDALQKSQAFIKNILESVDEGFIVVDREYRVLSANKAFCRLVGLPEAEVTGRFCYEVSHHHARPCFESGEECAVRRTFETGATHSVVHMHSDASGAKQYVEIKSYPITDATGRVVSAIETVNDITEKKRLEEQLRQAQKMEAIGILAGGVAHDFNNILTAIIGYGSIVKMKMKPDDPQRASIDQILTSSDRAAHLTQGLLAFSRKQVINPKPVDLNDVVKSVEKLLRRLIGEDVELSVQFTDRTLITMADAGQIEQVLMNLATNARDAMPGGGVLAIATEELDVKEDFISVHGYGKPGKYALLTVTDTGHGMDDQTREKIFEPFFTTKETGKGTGLGLAIVYGIVKQHDGNINVYSEPGKGTTFKIYLPLITTAVEETKPEATAPPARGSETILVAEDDSSVRTLTSTILRDFGYRVIEAVDGQDAVEKYTTHERDIDLLVLDVIMPKKSGREVYDAIRAVRPGINALFTSGYTADIIHKKGIFEEGLQFISKPVSPFDLLRKIRELLDRRK